eukprot:gene6779-9481_t
MAASIRDTSAVTVKYPWKPEEEFCSKGNGVEGEGIIQHLKFHTVTAKDKVERYIVARVKIRCAFRIELDKYGCEKVVDPSDYPDDERSLSHDDVAEILKPPKGILTEDAKDFIHPVEEGVVELMALASTSAKRWNVGEDLHFKTRGNSCFLSNFYYTEKGNFGDDKEGE